MWRESDGERQIVERSSLARATSIKHLGMHDTCSSCRPNYSIHVFTEHT
jgi:hypothetical protein